MGADASDLTALAGAFLAAGAAVQAKASLAVRKAAGDVKAQAQSRAPVRTGNLRGSISVAYSGGTSATVGPTAAYGRYLEYGTSRMPAQPYMTPAADAVEPAFIAAVEQIGENLL